MKNTTMIFAGAMTLLMTTAARPAGADCIEGSRNTSAAEKAAHKRVGAVMGKAFVAPPGFQVSGEKPHQVPGSVCRDSTGERLHATYKVSFMEMDGAMERQEKLNAEMKKAAEGDPKDMAARMEAIQKMTSELQRGTLIEVDSWVNRERIRNPGLPITVPGGYRALQGPEPGEIAGQLRTIVLLGNWKKSEAGEWRAPRKKGTPVHAIHSITVEVQASDKVTRSFLASSNLKSLAALIDTK